MRYEVSRMNRTGLSKCCDALTTAFKRIKLSEPCMPHSSRPYISMATSASDAARMRKQEARSAESRNMERSFTREWQVGDVYAPHDLSAAEARKWRKKNSPTTDAFDALNLNPLDLYKNFAVMSEYMTEMGRIRPQSSTGLRRVNQRKIAKAIRRAIALGLMPSVHRHPEIIRHAAGRDFMRSGGRR